MKQFIFLFLFFSGFLFAQWEAVNEGVNRIHDIDFVDENMGWMVSNKNIYRTLDAGEIWNSIYYDREVSLRKIDFIDINTGWCIANKQDTYPTPVILRTQDGGLNWSIYQVEVEADYLYNIHAVNDSIAYFTGNKSKIYKTKNGGENWIDITPAGFSGEAISIYFINDLIGFVSSKKFDGSYQAIVLQTLDGGNTWTDKIVSEYGSIHDMQIVDGNTVYFLATDDGYWGKKLSVTRDTFSTSEIIYESERRITSFFVNTDNSIYCLDQDFDSTRIMKSLDGGLTWENKKTINFARLEKIYFSSAENGLVLGESGEEIIFRSEDTGQSWDISLLSYPFKGLTFIDKDRGFAYGQYYIFHGPVGGDVYFTNDGGENWESNYSLLDNQILSCTFVNNHTGYILAGNWGRSLIYKTTNLGNSWAVIFDGDSEFEDYYFNGKDIHFEHKYRGHAIGGYHKNNFDSSGATILGTIDGGENWQVEWEQNDAGTVRPYLHSIYSVTDFACAIGRNGLIVRNNGDDKWQSRTDITDLPLNDVFIIDKNHGWITGGYHNRNWIDSRFIFLKTIDGGENWTKNSDIAYHINDMYFADSLHGWAVGLDSTDHGVIIKTNDGGETWVTQVDTIYPPFNGIQFKDGYGWVVGELGIVLKTEDGLNWIDESEHYAKPTKFKLKQNFPNPFNPITSIEYQVPLYSSVELSIYNTLGQKVATLVNKKQKVGDYKVDWDASGFASGIYIYQLKTSPSTGSGYGQIKTKKLILLR